MDSLRIAIRVDGDDSIGAGHVARCLPLAGALRDMGHRPLFVGRHLGLAERMLAETTVDCVPASAHEPAGVSVSDCDAVIVDSYEIDHREICQLGRQRPIATLAEASRCPDRGVLLDYHFDRMHERPTRRLLPGPGYAPVDPRFSRRPRLRDKVDRVLLTSGASSAGGQLELAAAAAIHDVFPQASVLCAVDASRRSSHIEVLPPSTRLWDVVGEVDLAVSAAGFTAYELACAGVPAVLVALVENQRRVAAGGGSVGSAMTVDATTGLSVSLRRSLDTLADRSLRHALSVRGRSLVDGRGAARAAAGLVASWRQSSHSVE